MNRAEISDAQTGTSASSRAEEQPTAIDAPATLPKASPRQVIQAVVGIALALAIIGFGLPYLAHTSWHFIAIHLQRLGAVSALELFGYVALALWIYTFMLTGSLPGLKHHQAVLVNVSGSAAANLLPAGGAAGVAVSYLMYRSWGFTKAAISTSVIVSGVWNVVARMAMPLLGVALLSSTDALPRGVRRAALTGGVLGLVVIAGFVAVLISPALTDGLGRWLDRWLTPLIARRKSSPEKDAGQAGALSLERVLVDQRSRLASVTRTGWLPMTFGVVGMLGTLFILFARTMSVVGVDLPLGKLFAAYAIGRLLTAVGVTPGGLGFTEAGTMAVLVAWGADRPAAAAGVLIFAIFTHVLEVPLGIIGGVVWWIIPKVGPPTTE